MACCEMIPIDGKEMTAQTQEMAALRTDMQALLRGQQQMISVLIAQQAQIEKLNLALGTVRISRTQELALQEAVRMRAKQICRSEGLPGAERRVAGAIRTTLREATGVRAMGEVQAGQYDRAMSLVCSWHMAGAIRRIRRETGKERGTDGQD